MAYTARMWSILLLVALLTGACIAPLTPMPEEPAVSEEVGLANPASVNCAELGGTSQLETRPDGGQYGVCVFDDNMQCEEWALLRGECPTGGVKVPGFATDAGRFCAVTGGEYTASDESGNEEQGTCTLPGGAVCKAAAYYAGTCTEE